VRRTAVAAGAVADTLTLDYEQRHRRRIAMTADGGLAFLLDLDRATLLDDGDAVRLEDGRLVAIRAAPQRLVEIRAGEPLRLQKIIWHLGNRHVPTEIAEDAVYIAEDHVLVEMVRGLGACVAPVERPFRPEGGAYEQAAAHPHAGHNGHAQAHGHDHD
jgi:urease accessory protein